MFDRSENDPRIYGVSSNYKDGVTSIKKASFTSCKKNDKCPPWSLQASEIKHDTNKNQLIYDNSIIKFYDIPIFYFPKFFHPDPTVKRQTGFLLPKINNSNVLGSSLNVPYFHIISENKDLTFSPILFSKNIKTLQTEYRQKNKNSSFIADFGITNGFKSSLNQKKKNINHFFGRFKKNLNISKFLNSNLEIFAERVNKDTYLKIFSSSLTNSEIKPNNFDILNSGFNFSANNETISFLAGADIYEDLNKLHSDRYQYVLPYFNLTKTPKNFEYGSIEFQSTGNNILDNTNNIKSRVINDFSIKINERIFENIGLKNNFNFYFKNLNSVGKNVSTYKTSPQIELQSLIEINSEIPLIKKAGSTFESLVPRLSLRINPGDMKNHTDTERYINVDNIFDVNRLGINDSFEGGNSLTLGIDYKKQNINNENDYFNFQIASVIRDDEEKNIPSRTSLNEKNSNIFGALDYALSDKLKIDYNFAIDNKIEKFNYNSIGLGISLNNFVTEFNFIEENTDLNNANIFENKTKYSFNSQNSLSFKTRRNREINLTEYYDLVYEYQNDCLTAGISFNKTYYEDRDLKPSKNLMFTISFYPLTTIEQSVD